MAHVHLDRHRQRDLRAGILDPLPAQVGHAGHVDEQVVRTEADVAVAARSSGELVKNRPDAERREDMRRDLQAELAPDGPGLVGRRVAEVDLAAHDHVHELVARREPLLLDAGRIGRILVAGNAARALEVAERGAAPGVEQRLDRGVGVLRRVVDLRDVVHRRHAVRRVGDRPPNSSLMYTSCGRYTGANLSRMYSK